MQKTLLRVVLPCYLTYLAILLIALIIPAVINIMDENALNIYYICLILVFCFGNLIYAFALLPALRKKYGIESLKKIDLSPYDATDREVYEYTYTEIFHLLAEPFDEEETLILDNSSAQTFYEDMAKRLICWETDIDGFQSFTLRIDDDNELRNITYEINKKISGDRLEVTVKTRAELAFTPDGLEIAGKHYDYGNVSARCHAGFIKSDFRIGIFLQTDDCTAYFALCGKIIAIVRKYGISLENPELLEFILEDPDRAYAEIAGARSIRQQLDFTVKKKKA